MDDFNIGESIRQERQRKGISQEAMAWHLGISQVAYSKIERAETPITVERVYHIAKILRISAYKLMPFPEYEPVPLPKNNPPPGGMGLLMQRVGGWFTGWW